MSRLSILNESALSRKELFELQTKKRCEELWNKSPIEKLDPMATAIGRERVERTWSLIDKQTTEGKKIVDLGCGNGIITSRLSQRGAQVTAIDGAQSALNLCKQKGVTLMQAFLPYLPLADQSVEGVVLADVIADIEPPFYRLLMSEIARVLPKEGWFICSTGLDLYSEDALMRFMDLVKSEFEITTKKMSYHRLHYYLWQWIKAPLRWSRASKESAYRSRQLEKRRGLVRLLFYLHSLPGISLFWHYVAKGLSPLYARFLRSHKILIMCEKASRILWGRGGVTHVIVFAKKRPFV